MISEGQREKAEELRSRAEGLRKELSEMPRKAQDRLDEAVLEAARKKKPRVKKWNVRKAKKALGEEYEKLSEEHREAFKQDYARCREEVTVADRALEGFLAELEPSPGELWFCLHSVYLRTYATQGWGAERYAQGAADSCAEEYRRGSPGITVRVRSEREAENRPPDVFRIEAAVLTELDGLVVGVRRAVTDLREWVRSCWEKGVNPRVYNPFLPVGYEEEQGLDFFGRDLRKDQSRKGRLY